MKEVKQEAGAGGRGELSPTVWKYISLITLTLQNAVVAVSVRYSRSRAGDIFTTSTIVLSTEVLKLFFSLLLVYKDETGVRSWLKSLKFYVWDNKINTLIVSIPALVYHIQNNLLYVSASHLDTATYHVSYQSKILTTAIFSVIILKTKLRLMQWFSLAVLIIGILLVQLSSGHEERRANSNENRFVGICAAFGAALCSGFASIFFEKILKGSDVSIWMRNVQLALLSVVFGGFNCAIIDYESVAEKGFFFGYDAYIVYLLVIQAFGGMVIAMVVKYADNLLKGFAICLSIILSSLLSVLLLNYQLTIQFGVGAAFVLISIYLYGYQYQPSPPMQEGATGSVVLPK